MYTNTLTLLVIFLQVSPGLSTFHEHDHHDHILCRNCGAELTENTKENFVNVTSPHSESSHWLSVLGHSHLMVQTLRNPADIAFDLVTVKRTGCSGIGEWYSEHSWFPGYSWKVCVCPRCKAHLGCFRLLAHWTSQATKILTMAEERQDVCVGEVNMVELDSEFLKTLEEQAEDRYSENDKNFMEYCSKPPPKPPILPAERFDRNRRGGFRGRSDNYHGRQGGYNRNRDNRRDFGDDRRRNWGGERRDFGGERRDFGGGDRRDFGGERRDFGGDRRDFGGDRRDFGGDRRDYGGERRDYGGERRDFGGGDRRDFGGGDRRDFGGERRDFGGDRREFGGDRRDFGGERRDYRGERKEYGGERRDYGGERKDFEGERRNDRRDFGGGRDQEYRDDRRAEKRPHSGYSDDHRGSGEGYY
ncbi:eukaryotic translation initiation factor 3 subunit A-like [Penaeus japonicus]|uniref:eukaryotic translation initiation factor 3 subunit A-like n=1 Tax=Penaeus japonicus TaxID=27405 RepID=UPI001C70FE29|nr:eukaryotic translation initiation factor 3 subunit A-like [Penaeus japonicus]